MPAAAAIAVATATAAQADLPKKADGPALHQNVPGQVENPPPSA